MYRAKSSGGGFCFYAPEMGVLLEKRIRMTTRLNAAIEAGNLELYFQPLVSLPAGTLRGAEALVRWNDAEFGWVSPNEFIPIAEERGMMGRLGEQGMRAPPTFGEAGKSMEGATGSLRQGARDPALEQQGQALSKLREGAQNMARQMMQQGTGSTGNYGRHGEARGDDRDPLGRPYRTTGEDYGPERNMLPSEMAIRRAREILDMLRSRANIPDLPRIDRDYIDRLLRGLY